MRCVVLLILMLVLCTACKKEQQPAALPVPEHRYIADGKILGALLYSIVASKKNDEGCSLVMAETYPIANKKEDWRYVGPQSVLEIISQENPYKDHDLPELVKALFIANQKVTTLEADASCDKEGFVMSSTLRYTHYFKGKWKGAELLEEHPHIKEIITLSLPVYDKKTGDVLVYFQSYCGPLCARGGFFYYLYKDGVLTPISGRYTWMS